MNSNILILPIVARRSLNDPDWIEQYERERNAAMMNTLQPPPRTRPIVVVAQSQSPEDQRC